MDLSAAAVTRVEAIFVGSLSALPPEGQSTGIFKRPVTGPVQVGSEGIAGDVQADRRVHGGPEKAVHHYAAENYAALARQFPALAAQFLPGSLGENVSTRGWTEDTVCVGDVFALGACRVQVSQPRLPCWKIDHRFGEPALSRFVAQAGIAGWYYRVIEGGSVAPGDAFELLERNPRPVSLRRLWRAQLAHRPEPDELETVRATPGLSPGWVRRLGERLDWLARNRGA